MGNKSIKIILLCTLFLIISSFMGWSLPTYCSGETSKYFIYANPINITNGQENITKWVFDHNTNKILTIRWEYLYMSGGAWGGTDYPRFFLYQKNNATIQSGTICRFDTTQFQFNTTGSTIPCANVMYNYSNIFNWGNNTIGRYFDNVKVFQENISILNNFTIGHIQTSASGASLNINTRLYAWESIDGDCDFKHGSETEFTEITNETQNETYILHLNNMNVSSNSTAILIYNNTNYSTDIIFINESNVSFSNSLITPLLSFNDTTIDFKWQYIINYTHNGTQRILNSSNYSQQIYFKYYPRDYNDVNGIEGEIKVWSFNINSGLANISNIFTVLNGTNYSLSNLGEFYYKNINLPINLTDGINISIFNLSTFFTLNYSNKIIQRNFNTTLNVFKILLTDCGTLTNKTTLNYSLYDETLNTLLIGNTNFYFGVWKTNTSFIRNYSFDYTNRNSGRVCIYPEWSNYTSDIQARYSSAGYSNKLYYADNFALLNSTKFINLYLTSGTSLVTFNVVDENDNNLPGALVYVQSYDVGLNSYKTTEILKTDSDGLAFGQIVLNTQYYQFMIEYNGHIYLQTLPTIITGSTRTFRINLGSDYYTRYNEVAGISHFLSYNDATKLFTFTWLDPSSSISQACLKVQSFSMVSGISNFNTTCEPTVSGTVLIDISGSTSNNTFIASSYVLYEDAEQFLLNTTSVTFQNMTYRNKSGLFATFLIVLSLLLVGLWSPAVSIVLMLLGFFISFALGFFYLSTPILITLIVMGGIVIYKMNH